MIRGSVEGISPIHRIVHVRMLLQEIESVIDRRTRRKSQDINGIARVERCLALRQEVLKKPPCQARAPLRGQNVTINERTRHSDDVQPEVPLPTSILEHRQAGAIGRKAATHSFAQRSRAAGKLPEGEKPPTCCGLWTWWASCASICRGASDRLRLLLLRCAIYKPNEPLRVIGHAVVVEQHPVGPGAT